MRNTIINSILALTGAYLLTIILHEGAHYVTAVILGYETELFHNRVIFNSKGNPTDEIVIAGMGPLFSLLLGIFSFQKSKRMSAGPQALFMLWLGIAGLVSFFGYLMVAPFMTIGDTGKVFALLNIPMFAQIVISIVAIISLALILIKSTDQFERFALENFGSIIINRKKWAVSLILIPLLVSILIVTILQFPVTHILSILATVCAPFSIMAVFGTFIGRSHELKRDSGGETINEHLSHSLMILLIAIIFVNRVLVNGV